MMLKYKTKPVEVLDDVICDICGISCSVDGHILEYATFKAEWGYGSHRDGEKWEMHMCEKCSEDVHNYIKSKHSQQYRSGRSINIKGGSHGRVS